jgi:FXSXX-COOH protein
MIATDDKRSEYPSDLADLRQVPLADVPALSENVLDSALRRLIPAPLAGQVPVAAFNSSI